MILLMQKFKTSGTLVVVCPQKYPFFLLDHRYLRGNRKSCFPQIAQEWTKIQGYFKYNTNKTGLWSTVHFMNGRDKAASHKYHGYIN